MDDGRFDAMVRVLGSGAPRRRVLAGLLASVPLALVWKDADAKRKGKKKGKKKNNNTKKPPCPREQNCAGKQCGDDGCDGVCGSCNQFANSTCTDEGQCVCEPDCEERVCGSDGCGDTCGTCQNGTCSSSGQCECAQGDPCGPNNDICCLTGTICRQDGSGCCRTECAGRCGMHHDTCSGEPLDCGTTCPISGAFCSDPQNGGVCVCSLRAHGGVQAEIIVCS